MIPRTIHPSPGRRAFTLVELLVVITIISILATLVYGAVSAAQKSSQVGKTRTTIQKIHRIVMRQMAEYRTRRVPEVDVKFQSRKDAALARFSAVMELMRMELPDRWSDIMHPTNLANYNTNSLYDPKKYGPEDWGPQLFPPLNEFGNLIPLDALTTNVVRGSSPPAATYRYYRQFYDAIEAGADPDAVIDWGSAELLYMIVMRDCENAEQFRSDEIGDYDGDGLMEFHDAWGHPIRFIRWPAGFVPSNGADTTLQSGDPTQDRNPFDTTGVAAEAFRLVPLIYSAGPDGIFDINIGNRDGDGTLSYAELYAKTDWYQFWDTAYEVDSGSDVDGPGCIGVPRDGKAIDDTEANGRLDHIDNIHNHQIGM